MPGAHKIGAAISSPRGAGGKNYGSKFRGRLEVGEVSSKHTCFLSVLEPEFPNYFLTGFHPSPVGFSKFWHFSLQQTSGA